MPPASGPLLPGMDRTKRHATRAQMAELVDAPASGAGARKGVEVRVLFWAPDFWKKGMSGGHSPKNLP